ncbi:S9 family peptidase [bacterium]|nr:S9 family peptidase [bacterium]
MLLCVTFALPASSQEDAAKPEPDPQLLRYLNVRYAGAGRWSADGKEIAFTTNWTGTAQKWRMPAEGGFPQQITFFEDAINSCDFSPHDPELMLCQVGRGGNERGQLYLMSRDGTWIEPLAEDFDVVHRAGDWSRDGRYVSYISNARDERFFDVYISDLETGGSELAAQLDSYMGAGAFSPDGSLMLVEDWLSNTNNDYYLLNLESKELTLLTTHEEEASFTDFYWAGDSTVYFICNLDREFKGIAKMNVHHPGVQWVHTPDYDVEDLNVSDDGRYIAWSENHDGFGAAFVATLPKFTRLQAPGIPPGVQRIGRFNRQSTQLLLQVSGPEGPTDLWRYELATAETTRLTYSATGGIDPATFVQPSIVHYQSFDGLELSALWYEPQGERPEGGWPVVVVAHGGPEGQSRPWFSTLTQLYLSRGMAVLKPNPRGSRGYGKHFMTLDNAGLREDSITDYASAQAWLVDGGIADPQRIAITGASYGGYVVLGALTLHPDKWAAGICSVGIANFVTFLENTGAYRRSVREAEYGSLEHDYDMLASISPIHRVEQITAPLLLIHGENDPRVPVGEARQMHKALSGLGREVELLVFPDEGHGIAKLENRAVAWSTELAFLEEHLQITQ